VTAADRPGETAASDESTASGPIVPAIPTVASSEAIPALNAVTAAVPTKNDGLTVLDRMNVAVEMWKKTVDVQEHFNDIELRIRNLAITVLGAVFSVAGLILKDARSSRLPALVVFLGAVLCLAFYFMDRWWYHRLLHGAVENGLQLEAYIAEGSGVRMGLAGAIKKRSPVKISIGRKKKKHMRSDHKIDLFYGGLLAVTLLFSAGLLISATTNSRQTPTETSDVRHDSLTMTVRSANPPESLKTIQGRGATIRPTARDTGQTGPIQIGPAKHRPSRSQRP
jgi:hypothetical protein